MKSKKIDSLLILLCWAVYTSAYLGRYSYNSSIVAIESSLGIAHAQTGLVSTIFFFVYGAGQIVNAIFYKKYNKKWLIFICLLISSFVNISIFLGLPFEFIKYVWGLNAAAQSVFWCLLIGILGENLSKESLPKSAVIMSSAVAIGTFVIYGISALFTQFIDYKYTFLSGAIVMIGTALAWILKYDVLVNNKDSRIEDEKESQTETIVNVKKKLSTPLLFTIIEFCVFAVIINLIKDCLHVWVPSILKDSYGLGDGFSILLSLGLPVFAMLAVLMSTAIRKKTNNYILVQGSYSVLIAILIFAVIKLLPTPLWGLTLVVFFIICLFAHGVTGILTAIAPLYMREEVSSGFLAGLLNGFCYLGSTISSYALGSMADNYGWNAVFKLLMYLCLIPISISIVDLIVRKKKK